MLVELICIVGQKARLTHSGPFLRSRRVVDGDVMTSSNLVARHLESELELDKHPNFRRRHGNLVSHPSDRRKNKQDFTKEENCDQALLTCLPEQKCADCFRFLYSEDIDWGRITPGMYTQKRGSTILSDVVVSLSMAAFWIDFVRHFL